ncbi:hypothetical protein G9C98_004804 [Cotesia typhae]|uniref:VPS35 endosomal protein sorting factor-like n=1 Tax=Cotesia typhae TaxID=2053667 RepID=A0A8J5R2X0_9HYME|nr:hypothetical protein G9C98_004804 [Cotesia typhae]
MTEISWVSCRTEVKILKPLALEETGEHPLKPTTISLIDGKSGVRRGTLRSTSASTSTGTPTPTHTPINASLVGDPLSGHTALDGGDPLTQFAREELDPLSRMAADEWDYSSSLVAPGKKPRDTSDEFVEPWSVRRASILNKYTTSEKLSIVTSFLSGGEKVVKVQANNLVDKVRNRLEQLDDFEEGSVRQMLDLSQQEYVSRIEQLNNELVQAWHMDLRVKALKIAIQCAKLLVDTSGMAFYPSKFVLITDILDIFGKLVYERLKVKADYYKPGSKVPKSLPDNFTPDMVPENAKETCRNWFYKIASIRELVPRLYVEMAIIKSYSFLTTTEFNTALLRITKMIRGIGNPLIAAYARCYLCRVGLALKTADYEFIRENIYDFLLTYNQLFTQTMKTELNRQNISIFIYLNLYTPALDWILQVLTRTADETILSEVISRCKLQANCALLLNAILVAFKPAYISSRAMEFVELVDECKQDISFPQYLLYRSLGECLVQEDLPRDDCQAVYEIIWRYITSLQEPVKFMHCAEVWIQFVVMHFSVKELNEFLKEIINHLSPKRMYENYYPQLQAIVEKIVAKTQDFESLLAMDNFLPLIDLFHKESIKVEVCKNIIEGFRAQSGLVTDPIIINALMYIARIMHDSVNALSVEDEKRQIGALICDLVQRVDYGRDFEKQLNYYAEARAAFPNLDAVHIQLVQCVNRQAVETRKIIRGHHTRRTSAFTIEIDGRPKNTEPYLLSYLSNFLSTLLVVPDSPEHGVLYLMRGLLNAVQRCFDENSSIKCALYLRVLDLLSTITLETYPYHVDKVDSNDRLYGSDKKFISEVDKICTKVLDEILNHLKFLGSTNQYDKQSSLSMDLFGRLVMRADLKQSTLANLAVSLWNLSLKHGCADPKMRTRTIEYVKRKSKLPQFEHLSEILKKIS